MSGTATGLLTAEDIELIAEQGAPMNLRPDLAEVLASGEVRLSQKGNQFYFLACQAWGVPMPKAFADIDALLELHCLLEESILESAENDLECALRAGKVEPQNRAWARAYLYGDLGGRKAAAEHTWACRNAGQNVLPFPPK